MKKKVKESNDECKICSRIPDQVSAHSDYFEKDDIPFPAPVGKLKPAVLYSLKKCPLCGAYYHYESDRDNSMYGGHDRYITRISPEKAIDMLKGMKKNKYRIDDDIIDEELALAKKAAKKSSRKKKKEK